LMAYRIAAFVFFASLGVSLVNSMFVDSIQTLDPQSNPGMPFAPDARWQTNLPTNMSTWPITQLNPDQSSLDYGSLFGGVILFKALADATVTLPWFIESLGIPTALGLLITGGVWLTYGVTGIYFLSGRDITN